MGKPVLFIHKLTDVGFALILQEIVQINSLWFDSPTRILILKGSSTANTIQWKAPSLYYLSSGSHLSEFHILSLSVGFFALMKVSYGNPGGWNNLTMYTRCRVLWKPTQCPWVDSLMLTLLLSSPCSLLNCFCLLSCLVHRCPLSPHRDAGGLCCVIRESWAGRCSSSTKTISSVNDKPHLLRCPKEQTEDHITGEQRIALCQICVPVIFANFSDRFFFGAPLPLVTSCGS